MKNFMSFTLSNSKIVTMLERTFKPFDFNLVNYRVMIYNGQLDVIIAWPLTENFITTLNWSANHNYTGTIRTQWHVGDDLAGYVKQVSFHFYNFFFSFNFHVLFRRRVVVSKSCVFVVVVVVVAMLFPISVLIL